MEDAGIDTADGIKYTFTIFCRGPLVGTEVALVFTRERVTEIIFEEAGRAHDDGRCAKLRQHLFKAVDEVRGKFPPEMCLEYPVVLGPDLLERPVFLVHEPLQIVEPVELVNHVRAHEAGIGNGHLVFKIRVVLVPTALQDLPGQIHTGCFAADLAAADPAFIDVLQVFDGENFFGNADEGELVADHALDQNNFDFFKVVADLLPLVAR